MMSTRSNVILLEETTVLTPVPPSRISVSLELIVVTCWSSSGSPDVPVSACTFKSVEIVASPTVVKQPAESYSITGIFVAEPTVPGSIVFAIIVVDTVPSSPVETNIDSVLTFGSLKILPSAGTSGGFVRFIGASNLTVMAPPSVES